MGLAPDTKDVSTSSGGSLTTPAFAQMTRLGLVPQRLIGPGVARSLDRLAAAHNQAHGRHPGRRADPAALRAVYRRGAGSYDKHRHTGNRREHGMRRVRAHLSTLATGRRPDGYSGDGDLLPGRHPLRKGGTKSLAELLATEGAPDEVKAEAPVEEKAGGRSVPWDSKKHPRDRVGRFIHIGSAVEAVVDGKTVRGGVIGLTNGKKPSTASGITANTRGSRVIVRAEDGAEHVVDAKDVKVTGNVSDRLSMHDHVRAHDQADKIVRGIHAAQQAQALEPGGGPASRGGKELAAAEDHFRGAHHELGESLKARVKAGETIHDAPPAPKASADEWSHPREGEGFEQWRKRLSEGLLSPDRRTYHPNAPGSHYRAMSDAELQAAHRHGEFRPLAGSGDLYVTDDPDRLAGGAYGGDKAAADHIVEFAPQPTRAAGSAYVRGVEERVVDKVPASAVRRVWTHDPERGDHFVSHTGPLAGQERRPDPGGLPDETLRHAHAIAEREGHPQTATLADEMRTRPSGDAPAGDAHDALAVSLPPEPPPAPSPEEMRDLGLQLHDHAAALRSHLDATDKAGKPDHTSAWNHMDAAHGELVSARDALLTGDHGKAHGHLDTAEGELSAAGDQVPDSSPLDPLGHLARVQDSRHEMAVRGNAWRERRDKMDLVSWYSREHADGDRRQAEDLVNRMTDTQVAYWVGQMHASQGREPNPPPGEEPDPPTIGGGPGVQVIGEDGKVAGWVGKAGDEWYAVDRDGEQSPGQPTIDAARAQLGGHHPSALRKKGAAARP